MSKVRRVTAAEAIRAFQKVEFELQSNRGRGSHRVLKKEGYPLLLTIPDHGSKQLGTGLLVKLIRAAGLTVEEFNDLLN